MTPEQQARSTAPAPHQISEQDRRSLQEAYRMIHAIAARSEEDERRNAEQARQRAADDSPIVKGDTSAYPEKHTHGPLHISTATQSQP